MSANDPSGAAARRHARTRDERRGDILGAARAIIDESGWEGFSIRGVASRADMSTGAVYQWFSGKDEIFGELLREEVVAGIDRIAAAPAESLHDAVGGVLRWVIDVWERLARYEVDYAEASTGRGDRVVAPETAASYEVLGKVTDDLLERAAAADGIELVPHRLRITWFWAACIGTAERLAVLPRMFVGERRDELLAFTTDSLVRSLTA